MSHDADHATDHRQQARRQAQPQLVASGLEARADPSRMARLDGVDPQRAPDGPGLEVHMLDARQCALGQEAQAAIDVVGRPVRQPQVDALDVGRRCLGAGLAQFGRCQPVVLRKGVVEAPEAAEAAEHRHLRDRHCGVAQQVLGEEQSLRRQEGERRDAMHVDEDAAQVAVGHAQPARQLGQGQGLAVTRGQRQRSRSVQRQRLRGIDQRDPGGEFRATAPAGPEAGGLGAGGVAEEPAVPTHRHADAAHGTTVHAGRGHADEEPAVEARGRASGSPDRRRRRPKPRAPRGRGPTGREGCLAAVTCRHLRRLFAGDSPYSDLWLRPGTAAYNPPVAPLPTLKTTRPCKSPLPISRPTTSEGVVGKTVDEAFAEHLGRAFGTEALAAGEKAVAVGRDGRLSGPSLSKALIRGLASTGLDVVDIGMVTTPMLYYVAATRAQHGCRSGIQITGSHNPKDYNGFKMVLAGRAIYGDEIQGLRKRIEAEDYTKGKGRTGTMDINAEYRQRIVGDCKLARSMKIVVDSGNGIAGASAPGILRALGCEVLELYSEVDGDFPNHHPDPSKPENLAELIATVKRTGAELGMAFDGDGDRLGLVTKEGHIVYPDRQLMLLAQDVLSRNPGGTVIFDVKCTQRLGAAIRAAGGKPLMWKTGHSLIKAKLKETGAPIAGEMSGHIFFAERWYGFDDGTYTAARMLEILSRSKNPSAVLNALPTSFSTPELNVPCKEGEHHALIEALRKTATFPGALEVITIDGLRAEYADGFGLIRASNTTPVLVMRFEGHTQAALDRIEAVFMAQLRSVKPDAQIAQAAH